MDIRLHPRQLGRLRAERLLPAGFDPLVHARVPTRHRPSSSRAGSRPRLSGPVPEVVDTMNRNGSLAHR
jgi:hypothetical protein